MALKLRSLILRFGNKCVMSRDSQYENSNTIMSVILYDNNRSCLHYEGFKIHIWMISSLSFMKEIVT